MGTPFARSMREALATRTSRLGSLRPGAVIRTPQDTDSEATDDDFEDNSQGVQDNDEDYVGPSQHLPGADVVASVQIQAQGDAAADPYDFIDIVTTSYVQPANSIKNTRAIAKFHKNLPKQLKETLPANALPVLPEADNKRCYHVPVPDSVVHGQREWKFEHRETHPNTNRPPYEHGYTNPEFPTWSAARQFNHVFSDAMELWMKHTNTRGAQLHPEKWIDIDRPEAMCFFAAKFYMGIVRTGTVREMWAADPDKGNPLIKSLIGGRRYEEIMSDWRDAANVLMCWSSPDISDDVDCTYRNIKDKKKAVKWMLNQIIGAPAIIVRYNKFMGAIDRLIMYVALLMKHSKTTRWYVSLMWEVTAFTLVFCYLAKKCTEPELEAKQYSQSLCYELRDLANALRNFAPQIRLLPEITNSFLAGRKLPLVECIDLKIYKPQQNHPGKRLTGTEIDIRYIRLTPSQSHFSTEASDRNRCLVHKQEVRTPYACYCCRMPMCPGLCFWLFHNKEHYLFDDKDLDHLPFYRTKELC